MSKIFRNLKYLVSEISRNIEKSPQNISVVCKRNVLLAELFLNWIDLSDHPHLQHDLKHIRPNQVTFGSNSLESVGPQIWNCLPNKMKSAENLKNFKLTIKQWNGPECKCSACYSFTLTDQ